MLVTVATSSSPGMAFEMNRNRLRKFPIPSPFMPNRLIVSLTVCPFLIAACIIENSFEIGFF